MAKKHRKKRRPFSLTIAATCLWYPVGRLVVLLPFRLQLWLGRGLGRLFGRLAAKPRRIVQTNLALCFPDWSDARREAVMRANFRSVGMGVLEVAFAYWASPKRLAKRVDLEGLEHLEAAHAQGKGVILLNSHFTSLELTATLATLLGPPTCGIYRELRENWLADEIIFRGRSRFSARLHKKSDVRGALNSLKEGLILWYASDQLARADKRSVIAPLFGVPALTNVGISRLVRMSGAPVVPYQPVRIAGERYRLRFLPPLENFPTGTREGDARVLNTLVEQHVLQAPEQYLWIRPRFKDRPEPYPDPYRR